jgi:WD40 repeat protein
VQRVELTHDVLAEVIRGSRDARQQRLEMERVENQRRLDQVAAAKRARRQHLLIAGLGAAVVALLIGAFFGIRAQRRAEQHARDEAAQSSRTDFILGSRLLEESKTPEGLAYLVRAARSDPINEAIGPRLISALANRSFAAPVGTPMKMPTPVWWMRYSPNGQSVVCLGRDDVIRHWDPATGELRQTIKPGRLTSLDLSPDGSRLATGGREGEVAVWDIASGKIVFGPLRHEKLVETVKYSPDGRWLIAGISDNTARVWDLRSGELKATLQHERSVSAVMFSPDSSRLITISRGFRIWRVPDFEPLSDLIQTNMPGGGGNGAFFSPDGALVAITGSGGAQLYDGATGVPVGPRLSHASICQFATFSNDGKKVVTTSQDATARIWEVPSGKPLFILRHGGATRSARFSPDDGSLLTNCDDGVARLWNTVTGRLALEPIRTGDVNAVMLSPDGTEFLTGGRDGFLRRWRTTAGAVLPLEFGSNPDRLAMARNGSGEPTAWAIYSERMEKIDLLSGKIMGAPKAFPAKVTQALLSPDEKYLAVRIEGESTELWNLAGTEIKRLTVALRGNSTALRFSPNSLLLANNTPEGVCVWNTQTGALAAGPLPAAVDVYAENPFSPDYRRLTAINLENVLIFDLASGAQVGEPLRHRMNARSPVFSPDGRLVATTSWDGIAQIWDAQTTRPLGPAMPHRTTMRGARFTHDGRKLLTWARLEVRLWDVATGSPLTEPMAGGTDIHGAVLSDDDTRIATYAASGREIRILDSSSGQVLAEPITGTYGAIGSPPSFHLSGRLLAAESGGNLQVWPMPPSAPRRPVPDWLLRLAINQAGGEIDRRGAFKETQFEPKVLDEVRAELGALPKDAPYAEWGRWILADRATRPIGPGFTVTAAELKKRRDASTAIPAATSGN